MTVAPLSNTACALLSPSLHLRKLRLAAPKVKAEATTASSLLRTQRFGLHVKHHRSPTSVPCLPHSAPDAVSRVSVILRAHPALRHGATIRSSQLRCPTTPWSSAHPVHSGNSTVSPPHTSYSSTLARPPRKSTPRGLHLLPLRKSAFSVPAR
jgi:hypothetical protein